MSRFFSARRRTLKPYVPGEQPRDMKYVKLNTNESPFPPSEKAVKEACKAAESLELYSDPECTLLVKKLSEVYGVNRDEILFTNGSDEILNFAFAAFCDEENYAVFPDITYGFYPVFAEMNNVPYAEIPLKDDLTIDVSDYISVNKTVFIANPNAPTGIALGLDEIESIVKSNPDNAVIIDEAYVDFGAESAAGLIHKYKNLLVTQTFSKSRSMAGARLGFGLADKELIADLNTVKYSTNPYNVNKMTMAAGIGALSDEEYTRINIETVKENRAFTAAELKKLGFEMTDSSANFIFAKHPAVDGEKLYLLLKKRGVLIRHFTLDRIKDYNRITIGTKEQMQILIKNIKEILDTEV
ncbi:MAG: histidinol-phosphate transaminase [Ruminococcaceae bacterium]|nr:histidinol-phosphate transaminase [Oscillospiraceae bacterium]